MQLESTYWSMEEKYGSKFASEVKDEFDLVLEDFRMHTIEYSGELQRVIAEVHEQLNSLNGEITGDELSDLTVQVLKGRKYNFHRSENAPLTLEIKEKK